ncbi:hypothetical protein KI387_027488 [Taxus chinensis]|uniref:Bifunctional inhibitor/plant lipid transfer protein/seed storage helical domain-containing protein n=1 Tax=Taxus chinensis TaxID=29808 RepID=A0AA38L1X0_TAXCH|nr:hypothetical protein KI387_027488 [Taxus chinensis]
MAIILRAYAPFLAAIMGAAALLAATGTGGVMAQQPPMGCTNAIVSLSPCLSYMTRTANPVLPTDDCCTLLATVITSDAACLCQLISSDDFLGFPINRTLVISLPASCNLVFPRQNDQCNGAFAPSSAGAVDLPETPSLESPPSASTDSRGKTTISMPLKTRLVKNCNILFAFRRDVLGYLVSGSRAPPPRSHEAPPRSHEAPPPLYLPLVPLPFPFTPDGAEGSHGEVQTLPAPKDVNRTKNSGSGALFTPSLFGIFLGSIVTGILTVGCFH